MSDVKKINGYDIKDAYARSEIAQMKINFQDGVDTIYNAIVAQGVTPSSSTPSACATGINNIRTHLTLQGTVENTTGGYSASVENGKYYLINANVNRPYDSATPFKLKISSGATVISDIIYKPYSSSSQLLQMLFVKTTATTMSFTGPSASKNVSLFKLS